jgi:hypothetical protein
LSNVACISFGEFLVVFCRLLWISDFVHFNSQDHMWASSRPHTTSSFIICFKRPVLCLLYSWSFMIPVKRHESLRLVSLKFLPAALSFTTSLQTDFRCFSEAVPWKWSFLSSWYAPDALEMSWNGEFCDFCLVLHVDLVRGKSAVSVEIWYVFLKVTAQPF